MHCPTLLGTVYFSSENIEILQNAIRAQVYEKSNKKYIIDKQDSDQLKIIMRAIYLQKALHHNDNIKEQIKKIEQAGFGKFPVCIAKTQYSFSTDPKVKGAPSGHTLSIREVRLSSGAEFIVVVCGSIMTMPGLPRVPAADNIKLNKKGEIEGLF